MTKPISPEESRKRREACRQANASIRIEGGRLSEETLAMQERYILGEITWDGYRAYVDKATGKLARK